MSKNKKAFTLIEMVVVIAIIGILSTMILTSVGNIRKSSVDSRRKSNLENVRGAITMYYSAKSAWPTSTNWSTLVSNITTPGYLADNIVQDDDGDSVNDYDVTTCSSPCQMKICSACEVSEGEGCSNASLVGGGDTRKWYCLEVK